MLIIVEEDSGGFSRDFSLKLRVFNIEGPEQDGAYTAPGHGASLGRMVFSLLTTKHSSW